MSITFSNARPTMDDSGQSLLFLAVVDGVRVINRIRLDVLKDDFADAAATDAFAAFDVNDDEIRLIARRKISEDQTNEMGGADVLPNDRNLHGRVATPRPGAAG